MIEMTQDVVHSKTGFFKDVTNKWYITKKTVFKILIRHKKVPCNNKIRQRQFIPTSVRGQYGYNK